jgi:EAL domain-containing protein (putative c-di-GMP-specific phosphodiesterase class I)
MIAGKRLLPARQEAALTDYVERLSKHTAGRQALHLRMSTLRPQGRRPERLRIAALAFEPLVSGYDGALFHLSNDDFIVFCKDASAEVIDRALSYLRNLYAGDPVVENAGKDLAGLCRRFDLATSCGAIANIARAAQVSARKTHALNETVGAPESPPGSSDRILDPAVLGSIQTAIAQADLTNMIRRQQVCAVIPGKPPQPVFSEVFTSMAALREILTPDIDIHGNRWLFQDLTAHLDRRVINFLGHKDDSSLSKAFSINLNVASLGSQEFFNFDRELSSDVRCTVVIELQLIDILADLDAFLFYRNFLRERSYRFCLDGLTCRSLPLVNIKRMGVDLAKIIWSPEFHDRVMRKDGETIEAVKEIDPKRVILIRCDDERAFETGKALGVSLYQGYLIDDMLKPGQSKRSA